MSKDSNGDDHQRLHALDLITGAEQFSGPVDVQATYPGTGDNTNGTSVVFDPKQYKERASLLLLNGVVYTSWASHCDIESYTGWIIGSVRLRDGHASNKVCKYQNWMKGELSHGLPWLATFGNRICRTDTEKPVILRGINRSGLEYSEPDGGGFLSAACLSEQEIAEVTDGWGANIIRLPFNQDWALDGRGGFTAESYRQSLDQVIEWAASHGAYTLLDLQWLDADTTYGYLPDGSVNHVAPLPDRRTPELWQAFAERYTEEPAVLFDVFNEPHSALDTDYQPLHVVNLAGSVEETDTPRVTFREWNAWAAKLAGAIQDANPRALIWVSGVDWASDLRGVSVEAPNIVYSAHVYPNRARRNWTSRFGHVSFDRPLFIGEWGGGEHDLAWGIQFIAYARRFACGWTAWSWMDHPHLVRNARGRDYTPTAFGDFVRSELRA